MSRVPRAVSTLLLAVFLGSCPGDPSRRLDPEERIDRLQDLLVRAAAHAEIDEWTEALELLEKANELADGEPAVDYGLAVAHFRLGDGGRASDQLDEIGPRAPAWLRARAEYVRGKLALEEGDASREADAYRRASELDPDEAAFPYSLSQVIPRLGDAGSEEEVGRLLTRAFELWPSNGRLAAELAQWSLGHEDQKTRDRGIELLVELASGQPEAEALVARGLEELAADPDRTPVSLRRALNMLRPGKRFQTDSALLEARLAVMPLAEPVGEEARRLSTSRAAEVALDRKALLPVSPFDGEDVLQIRASNDASGDSAAGEREVDLLFATARGLWFLGTDDEDYAALATWNEAPRDLVVGELDGDGLMEILVADTSGVTLWGRSADASWSRREIEPRLASAGSLEVLCLVDFEHDGDLDLLAVDGGGRLVLATHRGEAGLGPPEPASLPVTDRVEHVLTVDLDGDADQDLLVVSGEEILVLANWRQGDFSTVARLAVSGDVQELLAIDYSGDGRSDLVGVVEGRLSFWTNGEQAGLQSDVLMERQAAKIVGSQPISAVTAGDLDLDGDPDLLVAVGGDRRSIRSLINSSGKLSSGPTLGGETPTVRGLLMADLDADRDPDLLAWGTDGVSIARATGAEQQGWLGIALRGLKGKVPLDGRGARVEVRFGLDKQVLELDRPEVLLGLGGRQPSLVKVTWPNGISEYIFRPESNTAHLVEQQLRIEGSCPFLYASDGRQLRFVTDILGLAPLGMLSAPGRYVPADPEEYLRLPEWVAAEPSVELRITEELREVAYFDQLELVVVDAPREVSVYNGERWIEGRIDGLELRLLGPLEAPTAVRSDAGEDVLEVVAQLDHRYLTNHSTDRLYQGAVAPHRLEVEISPRLARSGRAALVLTGWLHWGNTSTNLARAQDPAGRPVFPYLEVPAAGGGWRRVEIDVGLPAGKTKPVVVDLSGLVDANDPRLSITTDFEVYWDWIAVGEILPTDSTAHRVHRLRPASAELAFGGFSRWYRPAENGPYLFDYGDRRSYPWRENRSGARPVAWQEHEGFYTRYGSVLDLVTAIDDRLVIFGAGEELAVTFDTETLPPLPEGWERTLFLHSEGWEKDGDPNVACGQTVGPLPWRGMGEYPCSELQASAPRADSVDTRTDRWVDRNRLQRRIESWSPGR